MQPFRYYDRYSVLTFNLDGDAGPLRLLVVSLEHGVVGLARDQLPVLEARGHEGDAALRLVRLLILKWCLVMLFGLKN